MDLVVKINLWMSMKKIWTDFLEMEKFHLYVLKFKRIHGVKDLCKVKLINSSNFNYIAFFVNAFLHINYLYNDLIELWIHADLYTFLYTHNILCTHHIVILNSQQKCHCIIIDKFIELPPAGASIWVKREKKKHKYKINNYFIQSTTTN